MIDFASLSSLLVDPTEMGESPITYATLLFILQFHENREHL